MSPWTESGSRSSIRRTIPLSANACARAAWRSWQRSEDYYNEGQLVWLDADTLIRERSGGKRSLDDFARGFFGVDDGAWTELAYTFDDVVKALNAVEPYDWAGFLNARLTGHGPGAPLDGIARGGYKLVYTETPTAYAKTADAAGKRTDLNYSLGLSAGNDAVVSTVMWQGPAFKAGRRSDRRSSRSTATRTTARRSSARSPPRRPAARSN